MTNYKTKHAIEGDKIKVVKCKDCNEEIIIDKGKFGSEVFICDDCKFTVKKKSKN